MCSTTGVGERPHKVLWQIRSKLWFPWHRKPPLTYNGENDVSTFSRLVLIRSFLYLQVTKTCIKYQTTDYGVSCPRVSKIPIDLYWENAVSMLARNIIKVAGNHDRHKSSDEFDLGPDQTTHFGLSCP